MIITTTTTTTTIIIIAYAKKFHVDAQPVS